MDFPRDLPIPDGAMRQTAFIVVRRRAEIRGELTSRDLLEGFIFEGQRVPLINPQRGIFKPQQMQSLLSRWKYRFTGRSSSE